MGIRNSHDLVVYCCASSCRCASLPCMRVWSCRHPCMICETASRLVERAEAREDIGASERGDKRHLLQRALQRAARVRTREGARANAPAQPWWIGQFDGTGKWRHRGGEVASLRKACNKGCNDSWR
eukprot:6199104-Pleurochrysis_carterae.AAC.1